MIRCYYKCSFKGCPVRKTVEQFVGGDEADSEVKIIGEHCHVTPAQGDGEGVTAAPEQFTTPACKEVKATLEASLPSSNIATSSLEVAQSSPTPAHRATEAALLDSFPAIDTEYVVQLQQASPHFVISDPTKYDNPIVFASEGFLALTGYSLKEVVGKNCRFLQGKDTNPHAVLQLSKYLQREKEIRVVLLNYKKDGTPFWNLVHISPIHHDGKVVSFVGTQLDVTQREDDKLPASTAT